MSLIKNNFFIVQEGRAPKKPVVWANTFLKKMGLNYRLARNLDPMVDMNTPEQRINFFHLLSSVIEQQVPGDIVELGSFNGQCAILFQEILNFNASDKKLHLYDSFEHKFTVAGSVEEALLTNFASKRLTAPIIHKGLFEDTLPAELPEKIAFVHIDCGFGGDMLQHKKIVLYCLQHIYARLSKDGVCVLMDYHDAQSNDPGTDYNPGVKLACDDFFKLDNMELPARQEAIVCLYGNEVSHAYFRKK